jgi:hypothetical protein
VTRNLLLLALLLAAGSRSAFSQEGAVFDPAATLQERLDSPTGAAVQSVIDSAAAKGLPVGPLLSKALEGSAKHADPTRIVAAVRSLSADLSRARNALGPDAGEDALVAGVGALRVGVSAGYIREVRQIRGALAAAWPLIVLADLVSRGVPVDTAASVVFVLARAHAADNSYLGLQDQLRPEAPLVGPSAAGTPSLVAPVPSGSPVPVRRAPPSAPRHP